MWYFAWMLGLPLALLLGHAMIQRVEQAKTGALRLNGLVNLLVGAVALAALIYFQIKKPFYDNEPQHMALLVGVLLLLHREGLVLTGHLALVVPLLRGGAERDAETSPVHRLPSLSSILAGFIGLVDLKFFAFDGWALRCAAGFFASARSSAGLSLAPG